MVSAQYASSIATLGCPRAFQRRWDSREQVRGVDERGLQVHLASPEEHLSRVPTEPPFTVTIFSLFVTFLDPSAPTSFPFFLCH